ncbi:MAG TPA: AAA family ATPase, partial [Saprospiraceae bacterium]|nr:AAA family ATPase [Saprospiraceae bacterium]
MAKRSALFPPPDAYIHDRLRFENPWWANGHTDAEYRAMSPRLYFDLFFPLVQDIGLRRAVVLMGPRRVGKTVMMHHSVQRLLDKGVPANRICYINIENPIYTHLGLEQLFGFAREATKASSADVAGWYVLFDEIQYLKDWERHLKTLTDAYPKCKFVVSGSAAAALKLKSNESGAGRFTDFLLPPLTFYEYISLRNLSHWMVPAYTTWKEDKLPFFSTTHLR